jgi:hypothetical protein
MKTMKTGKYMFVGNVNALFGPGIRYADNIANLKLKAYEKEEITKGVDMLCAVRNGKITRINVNGHSR